MHKRQNIQQNGRKAIILSNLRHRIIFLGKESPSHLAKSYTSPDKLRCRYLHDIELLLELHNQLPFILADIIPVEFLQCVNALSRDGRVERVLLFQVATIHGLVGTLDLNRHGRLSLLAHSDGLVITFNRCAMSMLVTTLVKNSNKLTLYQDL